MPPELSEQDSAGLPLPSVPTVQTKKLSATVIVNVPPLPAVTKAGGPGFPAKVNVTGFPSATMVLELEVAVMDVTFPITVTVAVPLRP